MRATVLCVLAFAGATCALQIPSLPSPKSMFGAGSSMLDNLPQINPRADDSSSSSSSSTEDNNTPELANELANRLVQDALNAAEGAGSLGLLPLKVGRSLFNTIAEDIKDFMVNALNLGNTVADSKIPALAIDLAKSVVRDIERLALDAGTLLLEPAKFKARLIETIASDVAQWLKKIQGEASQQQNPRASDRTTEPPRPTPARGHRPTRPHRPSSPRPRPTPSRRPTPPRPRPTTPERPSSQRPRPTTPERPRPTTSERPSSPTPRPTTSERPSSSRPGSTTSERPGPTTSARPSSSRPGSTTSERPGPTTSARPSSSRPSSTTSERPGPTTSESTTSARPGPTTSASTTSARPSSTTSASTTSSEPSSTTSTPSSTQQTSTIRDSSDEGGAGIDGSLNLGRLGSISGSMHTGLRLG